MKSQNLDRIKFPPGFWAGMHRLGIAAQDVARTAGLPVTVITESAVTRAQYFAIWQAYSELKNGPAEGIIQLATAFEAAKYPPSVLATYHALDYREALNRMTRYKPLCPPECLHIIEDGEHCIIQLDWLEPGQPGPQILIGITLAFLLELGRRGTGHPLTAKLVEFSDDMGDIRALEAYFGCPIRVGAGVNRMTLQRKDLDLPFVTYNEELLELLTPALDRSLAEHTRSRSFTETVIRMMKRSLTGGRPDIRLIAKELNMSERTLQRRLAEENTNFKQLLVQARHEQARDYLADPELEIKEVALLVGYEDQNSFYRAFRLWEGETPLNWRNRQWGMY
ncbi:AraC family transcriptional regulator [Paenibacillus faecis]|uniref:helix-turn-helix transcriptional regulator n=1 Tax=Paenibacillus faecis TaxID=862114 RepID=UPI001B0178A1|nr:AraC family transcriptional regulator [Paenibacillus faecis]GIO84897.1 AraC family transcriptional regulator [Paenibacillus faecis]